MYYFRFFLILLVCLSASADQNVETLPNPCHINYPNIPGELLLENDKLVVQRFIIQPGQWEGIHRHPADQLYVHIKGGEGTVKYDGKITSNGVSPTGEIGWSEMTTELSEMHESGNTGDEPIDLMWITLKPGCFSDTQ